MPSHKTKSVRPHYFACVSLVALFAVSAEAALPGVGPQASITCPANAVNISLGQDIPSVVDSYPEGTTFCVQAGEHFPASPINLKAHDMLVGQYGAVIDGRNVTMTYDVGSTSIIRGWNCFTDCSGVTVQNLVIRNLASYYCIGLYSRDPTAPSNNWTIDHNEIHGCKTGVSVSNQSGATVMNNYIHHNVGDPGNPNPSERGGGYGAYLPSNTTFSNNEIAYNGPEQKISLSVNVTFRNNFVHHNNFDGIWYDGETVDSLIEENISEDNPGVGIVYEASGQGIIRNNTVRRSGLSGILITISQNVEIYSNVLEDNYRGIEYFVDCASVGQGGYNKAANGGAGVIYDLRNNNAHDNTIKIGTRNGSLANTFFLSNCSSTQSDSYVYGSKNLIFQKNTYYVPSLTSALWYWGGVSRFWSEWQALGHDTTGSASEYAAPVITSTGSATGTVGVAFSYQIAATNNATSFNATGLPTGLSVNTVTGLISGTPTTSGTSSITLSATNTFGTGTRPLTLTINPGQAPVITSPSTAAGTVGVAFSYQITATNSPTSFDANRLPAGLSLNTSTGLISGTPINVGTTSNIVLRATNAVGTGTKGLTVTVNAGLPPAPVITSASSAVGTAGVPFSYQISASNSPTSYAASGLPAGLSVNTGTGLISGTPTTAGSSNVNVSAANAGGTGTAVLGLTINAPAPSITLVQSASNITPGASVLTATFPAAVSAGHLIVVSVSSWPNAPTGVTDSQGNVYSLATPAKRTTLAGGGSYTATYYARAGEGANTVTFQADGSNGRMSMVIAAFSGVNTMVAADTAISASGKNKTPSSGTLTPSVAGDLLIGAGTHDATTVTTPGSGFTMVAIATENNTTYQPLAMEYRILADTAAAATTFSLGAPATWAQTGVLFKR